MRLLPALLLLAAKPPCCLSASALGETLRAAFNGATALMIVMPLMLVTSAGLVIGRVLRRLDQETDPPDRPTPVERAADRTTA